MPHPPWFSPRAVLLLALLAGLAAQATAEPTTAPAAPPRADLDRVLIRAIRNHDLPKLKRALDGGATVNYGDIREGVSPLREAVFADDVEAEDVEAAELLLAHGADPNDRRQGDLPLCCAAWTGRLRMVECLMDHGAKAEPGPGPMPLHMAAEAGHVEVVALMLKKGADVNATDRAGVTPLHRAADAGQLDVVKVLIGAGADLAAKTKTGKTPLDAAVAGTEFARTSKEERWHARVPKYEAVQQLLRDAAARPPAPRGGGPTTKRAIPAAGPGR